VFVSDELTQLDIFYHFAQPIYGMGLNLTIMNPINGNPELVPANSLSAHRPSAVSMRVAPASLASAGSGSFDAMNLLRAFQRCWPLATGLGVLGGILAAATAWYVMPPPKYTAESLLLVEAEQPKIIATTKEYRLDPETDRRTQVALVKSLVLSKVVLQPEIAQLESVKRQSDPAAWLEKDLKAEFTGKLFRLSLTANDPVEVTSLVKAITQTYLSEVANKEKLERLARNRTLEQHHEILHKQLESKRNQLRQHAMALGSKDKQSLSAQQRLAISRQSMAEEELLRTQAELKRSMAELRVLQSRNQKDPEIAPTVRSNVVTEAEIKAAIQSNPVVQEYLQKEEQLRGTIENHSRVSRKLSDPAITRAKSDLTKFKKQRESYVKQLRDELQKPHAESIEVRKNAESGLAALEDQVEVMTGLEHELRDEVLKYTNETKSLGFQAIDMESIQDELKSSEELARLIAGELEVLKIELSAPDRVRLLQQAKAPGAIDPRSRLVKTTGMAGGGTFGAILLLISFLEFRAQRISSLDDVEHKLGIKVVGTVPIVPKRMSGGQLMPETSRAQLWRHQLIESVDTTRIMLMHAARTESLRVVLVTSAVGGEGKTSLASHLATSLARSGLRTVLVDGDFRRPMVHLLYDQPSGPGFSELLRGEIGADDVIRPASLNNLWLIPAGKYDDFSLSVLAQPRARNVFTQLREQFDFVIVDSAPLLPVADSLLLAQHADAAVFSIMKDVSQLPKIQSAYERIRSLGVPILGAVVSGTNVEMQYRY
jgi:polysaccharide biosynthesis transport protein